MKRKLERICEKSHHLAKNFRQMLASVNLLAYLCR